MAKRTQLKLAAAAAAAALLAAACGTNAAPSPEPPAAQPPAPASAPAPPPAEMPETIAPPAMPPEPIAETETATAALDISPPEGGGTPPPAPVVPPDEMPETITPLATPPETIAETEPTAPESLPEIVTPAALDDGASESPPPSGGRPPGGLPEPAPQPTEEERAQILLDTLARSENECNRNLSRISLDYLPNRLVIQYKSPIINSQEQPLPVSRYPEAAGVIAADLASIRDTSGIRSVRVDSISPSGAYLVSAYGDFNPLWVSRNLCQLDKVMYALPHETEGRPPPPEPQPEESEGSALLPRPIQVSAETATRIFIQSFGDDGFSASEPSTILLIGFATRPSDSSRSIATIDPDTLEVHGEYSAARAVAQAFVSAAAGHQVHRVVGYQASSQYLNHFSADYSAPGAYVFRVFGTFNPETVPGALSPTFLTFRGGYFNPAADPSELVLLPEIRYTCVHFCIDHNPPTEEELNPTPLTPAPLPPAVEHPAVEHPVPANECEKSLFSEFTGGGIYSPNGLSIDYNYNKPLINSVAWRLQESDFPAVEAVIAADLAALQGNFDIRNVRVIGGDPERSRFRVQADGDFEPFDVSRALCQLDDIEYASPVALVAAPYLPPP